VQLTPVTLEGPSVRLEPLVATHLDALSRVAFDPDLWQATVSRLATRRDLEAYAEEAWDEQRAGTALPFATVLKATGQVIGSTRFGSAAPAHRRVEIGWTWVSRPWQRSGANREAKYLMLRHAFEQWGVNADGSLRDSVYFSILAEEWPAVRRRLEERLG